jgi:hypothetical protein
VWPPRKLGGHTVFNSSRFDRPLLVSSALPEAPSRVLLVLSAPLPTVVVAYPRSRFKMPCSPTLWGSGTGSLGELPVLADGRCEALTSFKSPDVFHDEL